MDAPQPQETILNADPNICVFAATDFRGQQRRFGIKLDDRRRHMYLIGKTGTGKTTMMENMVINDIYAGHGIGVVDPHGDLAEKLIDYIPAHRINDVVYFNPADMGYPFGFNILENVNPDHKHLIVSGLMGVFKKLWPDVWSARMEYILNNTLLALLDYPGSTLLGVNRLLADRSYRKKVISKIKDPVVKAFWTDEFASYKDKYAQEAVAPIQNKVGQFLSASIIRNIVAQVKSTIDIREIMDSGKILIMNLSKGRVGEDNSRLLGGMLITKIQLSAMERVDTPEAERKDFILYVDEFQNFAFESFANILSEARKYRLSLVMAHQFIEQLTPEVAAAVFGNVGTIVSFRVGSRDSEGLAKEFDPEFTEQDLVKLEKYHVYMRLMVDGIATVPFSALSLPPLAVHTESVDKVIRVSRERYGVTRESVEEKILKWSGMDMEKEEDEEGEAPSGASGVMVREERFGPPHRAPRALPQKTFGAPPSSRAGAPPRPRPATAGGTAGGVGGGAPSSVNLAAFSKQSREEAAEKSSGAVGDGGERGPALATVNLFGAQGGIAPPASPAAMRVMSPDTGARSHTVQRSAVAAPSGASLQGRWSSEAGQAASATGAPHKKKRRRHRKQGEVSSGKPAMPPLNQSKPVEVNTQTADEISLTALKKPSPPSP